MLREPKTLILDKGGAEVDENPLLVAFCPMSPARSNMRTLSLLTVGLFALVFLWLFAGSTVAIFTLLLVTVGLAVGYAVQRRGIALILSALVGLAIGLAIARWAFFTTIPINEPETLVGLLLILVLLLLGTWAGGRLRSR